MRGEDLNQGAMFSYISLETRIPKDHPLRTIRQLVDMVLRQLSPRFEKMYSHTGRPSIPPERLLRALLLQVLYSIRRERQLVEQLDYNLLFRWFIGLQIDDRVWDATTFSQNRDRLLDGDVAEAFFTAVLEQARSHQLMIGEHFSVDGSLLEAWVSHKSFKPKSGAPLPPSPPGRNASVEF